jgi:hypothetical protein
VRLRFRELLRIRGLDRRRILGRRDGSAMLEQPSSLQDWILQGVSDVKFE